MCGILSPLCLPRYCLTYTFGDIRMGGEKKKSKINIRKAWDLALNFPEMQIILNCYLPNQSLREEMPFISLVCWHFVKTQQRLCYLASFGL